MAPGTTVMFVSEDPGSAYKEFPAVVITAHSEEYVSLNVFTFNGVLVRSSVARGTSPGCWHPMPVPEDAKAPPALGG